MNHRELFWKCRLIAAWAAVFCATAFAADTGSNAPLARPVQQHDQYVNDLQSEDAGRASQALAEIQAFLAKNRGSYKRELPALQILLDAKQYAAVESVVCDLITKDLTTVAAPGAYEKVRSQAFLGAGDTAEALGAAKAYYNCASLADTADAVDTVALCLAAAHPEDADVGQRFKDQQVAWATTAPSSQPEASDDSSLMAVTIDSKPFDEALARIRLTNYRTFASKGCLLLITGKADAARKVFEQAIAVAPAAKTGEAYENVARAIRAQSGCIAPANAYIAGLQNKK